MVNLSILTGYLGKHIKDICTNKYVNDADNHCAHFVSHVMGYTFGLTCRVMGQAIGPGANLRVQEVFPKCPQVGTWASRPTSVTTCLAFITNPANVNLAGKVFHNVPRKHIGIYCGEVIWHYSNRDRKVVKQTPGQFSHHYAGPDNAMFYGTLPSDVVT